LPYANCYVCNKSGHLAGNCPESSKGLDCPSIQAKKEQASDDESVTIDQFLDDPKKAEDETEKKVQKPKRKVVNF